MSWLGYQLNSAEASGRGSVENHSLRRPPSSCMVVWLWVCVCMCVCVCMWVCVAVCSFVCLVVCLFLLPLPTTVVVISPVWWCWMWGKWRHSPWLCGPQAFCVRRRHQRTGSGGPLGIPEYSSWWAPSTVHGRGPAASLPHRRFHQHLTLVMNQRNSR